MERYQEIERSIIKKFRPSIWHRFVKAVSDYNLIEEDDKVFPMVAPGAPIDDVFDQNDIQE